LIANLRNSIKCHSTFQGTSHQSLHHNRHHQYQQLKQEPSVSINNSYHDNSMIHFSEGDSILESLNGFILIINTNSEVFYASRTVEQYIGFHQSDIIHQSAFELIHSEDREEIKKQLAWNSKLPPEHANMTIKEVLSNKDMAKYLERNFTVRFRCLLDNTSGFLTLDIIGRLGLLHGQRGSFQATDSHNNKTSSNNSDKTSGNKSKNKQTKAAALAAAVAAVNAASGCASSDDYNTNCDYYSGTEEPILALFAIACPFGPPSLFELPHRDSLFKTKHRVNLEPISIDSK
jgi:hypothetical protein